jgi:hypothetical protein
MTKPTKPTPGQIFFKQNNIHSVLFVRVISIKGNTIYFQDMKSEEVEGSRTAMSHAVKPVPQDFKLIDIWQNTLEYNKFIGYHFGGNLDIEMGPFRPAYQAYNNQEIILHHRD